MREGTEKQDVWVLCEGIPVLVSSQNMRPATDAEALAHSLLNGEPVVPDAVVRGAQSFEDARDALMHLKKMGKSSRNIERRPEPSTKTMTCHLFHPYWRRNLCVMTRKREEPPLDEARNVRPRRASGLPSGA